MMKHNPEQIEAFKQKIFQILQHDITSAGQFVLIHYNPHKDNLNIITPMEREDIMSMLLAVFDSLNNHSFKQKRGLGEE